MTNKIDLTKIRNCSPLLSPPGGEVVRELCDEIERLKDVLHYISKQLLCSTDAELSADMAQFAWRAIDGSASVDEAEAQGLRTARKIMAGGE